MRVNIAPIIGLALAIAGCKKSLTFDGQGVAHGSGEKVYYYRSGTPSLREEYVDGKVVRSRWFKPDGSLIQETTWVNGTGEGIYLREDGSVRRRMQYVNGLAEGEAKEYDEGGKVREVLRYRNGERVGGGNPPATRPAE
jgi:antitoxin component YwqK of YwqJK toxin-antitoxin module